MVRIYRSNGKVVADISEKLVLSGFDESKDIYKYREKILHKIAEDFNYEISKAVCRGLLAGNGSSQTLCDNKCNEDDNNITEVYNDNNSDENLKDTEHKGKIDVGKALALRNAGWSIQKIADEFGVTYQGVYSALKKNKK